MPVLKTSDAALHNPHRHSLQCIFVILYTYGNESVPDFLNNCTNSSILQAKAKAVKLC